MSETPEDVYRAAAEASVRTEGVNDGYIEWLIEDAQARGEFAVPTGAVLDVLTRPDVAAEIARGDR